jgi:hypothetical protein
LFSILAVGHDALHTCGLLQGSGEAYCWGSNLHGQLGVGTKVAAAIPTPVLGDLEFSAIATGYAGTCALTADGSAYCWGFNDMDFSVPEMSGPLVPTLIRGGRTFAQVTVAGRTSCALTATGAAYCWWPLLDQLEPFIEPVPFPS